MPNSLSGDTIIRQPAAAALARLASNSAFAQSRSDMKPAQLVAAPYSAISRTQKDNKSNLVMNTTKDALKGAASFKYDKNANRWTPDVR